MRERETGDLTVWRCSVCSRILAKLSLGPQSKIEIKCGHCNAFNRLETIAIRETAVV